MTFRQLLPTTTLGPTVRFHSPFADYAGAADVGHLFALIDEVLLDVDVRRRLPDGDAEVLVLRGRAGGEPVDGYLETRIEGGRIADVTLALRPLRGVRAAMAAMADRLEERPLPSGATPGSTPPPS